MTSRQPEGRLCAAIISLIRRQGGWAVKTHPAMGIAGLPDLLWCLNGTFGAFEIKLPGKEHTVSKRQAHQLQLLERAGATAAIVTSTSQAARILRSLPNA